MGREMKGYFMVIALVIISVCIGGRFVDAQVHHVVGGDHGWGLTSDVVSWSSDKIFRVGDNIWFAYSAAEESILELKSKDEFESCDVSNPIRMYTDGLDKVTLDGEGTRYFASSSTEKCKNGVKLHIEVQPQPRKENQTVTTTSMKPLIVEALAAGPTPSGSVGLRGVSALLWFGLALLYHMGF